MNDIRKLLDIINETTAGATASGGVAPVSQSMHTQRRVEEDYTEESSDKPQMPQILEYGNWENSALTTSKKLKKSRKKASKIVKSVYGEDMPGEKVRVTESFGPLPKDNQQIRLGKYTVDIKRVGLNKNYIGFAWHDSKGQEHYEEVAVGDLGSYDDLLARIKGEIRYQERRLRQGVAEGYNDISVGDYVSYDDGPGTDRWEVVSIEGNRVELRNDQGETTFADINDVLKEQGVAETKVGNYKDLGATSDTTHFIKNVTTGKIVSPHRSRQDAEDALIANKQNSNDEFKIVRARKEGVAEGSSAQDKNISVGDYVQTAAGVEGVVKHISPDGKKLTIWNRKRQADHRVDITKAEKIPGIARRKMAEQGVAEGRPDKDSLNRAVGLYRELSKKHPHKVAIKKAAESHNLDPVKLNDYVDHGSYSSKKGVVEGQSGKPIKPGATFKFPNHWNKADVVHEFLWKKNAVVDVEYSYDTKKWTVTDSRPATEKDMEQWATINGGLPTVNEQVVAEGSEQDDPYRGATPPQGKTAARNAHRLGKTYTNPHSPKYHKKDHAAWDRDYNSEMARLKSKGVAEAGYQSPHAKLAQLKAKYDAALKSPNPNPTTLRRIRDQIIKLEFDLGIKEGVAEGSENQYSVKHDHPTNKNKYAFSTISAPDIKTAKKLANEKFDGVVSVQRLIKQQFAMEDVAVSKDSKKK